MQVNHTRTGIDNELITCLEAIYYLGEKEMNEYCTERIDEIEDNQK